jgi:N-methylhydantoinase B/oxoprolinase/acetone carboxylase alpha subunit
LTFQSYLMKLSNWAFRIFYSNLGLKEGLEGSYNYFTVIRKDGSEENYNIVTNVKLNKGDKVKLVTATGGGYGNPKNRPIQNWKGYKKMVL